MKEGRVTHSIRRFALFMGIVLVVVSVPLIIAFASHGPFVPSDRSGGSGDNLSLVSPFDTLHSLKGNSTIVILGTYAKISATWKFGGTVFTIFQVNVSSYLVGSGPSNIYVEGVPTSAAALPILGQDFVLFLVRVRPCPPSPPAPCPSPPPPFDTIDFIPTGGPQGEFPVQGGLVYGFKTLHPRDFSWIRVNANGVPLAQFVTQVQNA